MSTLNCQSVNCQNMDKNMEIVLKTINDKFNEQTITLTAAVTKNIMEALDEKMKTLTEENKTLKTKITNLEQKVTYLENEKRQKNLILFGMEEKGKSEAELVDLVKETIIESGIHLDSQEISHIRRIGIKTNENRPVLFSLTTIWKKHQILKNKRNLPSNVYINEDFPREVLETRKKLKNQLEEERKNGNIAYIKYDKLIVKKPTEANREKRKREKTVSPSTPIYKKQNTSNATKTPIILAQRKTLATRERSSSLTETTKNN